MNKAFIFDMNGTMINDMEYHMVAWIDLLKKLNNPLSKEEMRLQMYGKGEEMFDRIFGAGYFTNEEMQQMIVEKELLYQEAFRPHLRLINGLDNFIKTAKAKNIGLAIGTAASYINVDYLLDGLQLRPSFPVTVSAEDVTTSKPNPEVFLSCAKKLNVAAENCIVFEDSPKGIEAAANAGMQAVAITSFHPAKDFDVYKNVLFCIDNYEDNRLQTLLH